MVEAVADSTGNCVKSVAYFSGQALSLPQSNSVVACVRRASFGLACCLYLSSSYVPSLTSLVALPRPYFSLPPLESCLSKTSFTHVAYANQL